MCNSEDYITIPIEPRWVEKVAERVGEAPTHSAWLFGYRDGYKGKPVGNLGHATLQGVYAHAHKTGQRDNRLLNAIAQRHSSSSS